jgi:hypothetical protein
VVHPEVSGYLLELPLLPSVLGLSALLQYLFKKAMLLHEVVPVLLQVFTPPSSSIRSTAISGSITPQLSGEILKVLPVEVSISLPAWLLAL